MSIKGWSELDMWRADLEACKQARLTAEARAAELKLELTACKANKTLAIEARELAEAELGRAMKLLKRSDMRLIAEDLFKETKE